MIFNINQKGQSLVEALVALTAAVVIVSAIAVAVITSVNNSDFSKSQNLATHYAQQGIDILRSQSESDWVSFVTSNPSGYYCLNAGSTALTNYTNFSGVNCAKNINNFFVRQVHVVHGNGPNCSPNTDVTVDVYWSDGKCTSASNLYCHSVSLDTCLANINSVSTP